MFLILLDSCFFAMFAKSFCKGNKKLIKKERFFDFFCIFAQKSSTN